ncbi:MAG TPA: ABC transporter substrate-binding protein, partial [bacterium]|nr:ABC transporter substrate-binding protein [bacterium]
MKTQRNGHHHASQFTRRRFLQGSGAAAGALLASGVLRAPALRAARPLKLGYVSPQTGPLAGFSEADSFIIAGVKKALAGGLKVGGSNYPVEIIVKDSQSNPNRAADVANGLIQSDKVDMMLVASTPETTNPVSDQCEVNEVPCISTVAPWQPWFFTRGGNPAKGFKWTYHFFWGLEDVIAVYTNMWAKVPSNKVVGGLFPNDGDGNAWGDKKLGLPPVLESKGYKLIDPGRYQDLTDDFSAHIAAFKQGNAEIVTGVVIPPDWTTFWTQAIQQGFKPKIASVGKALLFPSAIEALGDKGHNLSTEVWWTPHHPFKSSLTGQSAKQLADAYTASTKKQWTQPIGFAHALFEIGADIVKRGKGPGKRDATLAALRSTRLHTIVGPVAWDGKGPFKN